MPKKSSAYYQRQYRERLRSQGLVKKEVWVLPDFSKTLSAVENLLRDDFTASKFQQDIDKLTANEPKPKLWTTQSLFDTLVKSKATNNQLQFMNFSVIEPKVDSDNTLSQLEPIIQVEMMDYGDLPIFLTVQGEQVIAETILCTVDEISDVAKFNDLVLRTHKYFPLSTISLDTLVMSTGGSYDAYQMFGSLSATASLKEVVLEIQMVASNVMQALEVYSECFKEPVVMPESMFESH